MGYKRAVAIAMRRRLELLRSSERRTENAGVLATLPMAILGRHRPNAKSTRPFDGIILIEMFKFSHYASKNGIWPKLGSRAAYIQLRQPHALLKLLLPQAASTKPLQH